MDNDRLEKLVFASMITGNCTGLGFDRDYVADIIDKNAGDSEEEVGR